jgi:pyruvate-ferredoxin/flavodoxin oxidoreductase
MAYSHCIAHGINMATGLQNQKAAVDTGQWLLYRYHPERALNGENPLEMDSREPKTPVSEYFQMENRFRMLSQSKPEEAARLQKLAQEDVTRRWKLYQQLAGQTS